jgi:glycerate kinase
LWFDINSINFTVVCDVKNPLYGENGAAFVYGSQKGASAQEIELLDLGLRNFSTQVEKYLNKSVATIPGAGAAGGLGAGAICFLNANIKPGIDFVLEQTGFEAILKSGVDLIITGEGSVDKQTVEGKVIKGISQMAAQHQIPFCIIAGTVQDENLIVENLKPKSIHSIMELGVSIEDAIQNASSHISTIACQLMQEL